MGHDRGDSFPFDFEPSGVSFGSKSKGKLTPQPYPIQFERKWKYSFLSVETPDWSSLGSGRRVMGSIIKLIWLGSFPLRPMVMIDNFDIISN